MRLALGVAGLATKGLARPLNGIRAEYGLAPVADLFEQLDHLARVLVLSSAGFDFPTRLPPNVRYVGPQLDDPDWAAGGDDWRPDGDGPLVLVAMSSIYQRQVDLLGTVAIALGSLPVRAVITTGRAVRPDVVPAPGNVRVVRAAPHRDVLREASVVVTHAGHGTVLKTLSAGVPLVCIPMGRDQHANTTRVLRLGAGVRVGKAGVREPRRGRRSGTCSTSRHSPPTPGTWRRCSPPRQPPTPTRRTRSRRWSASRPRTTRDAESPGTRLPPCTRWPTQNGCGCTSS